MRCNGQKVCCFHLNLFKWTKSMLFFSTLFVSDYYTYYFSYIKLNGSRLCWRATCQGYTWWPTKKSRERSSVLGLLWHFQRSLCLQKLINKFYFFYSKPLTCYKGNKLNGYKNFQQPFCPLRRRLSDCFVLCSSFLAF